MVNPTEKGGNSCGIEKPRRRAAMLFVSLALCLVLGGLLVVAKSSRATIDAPTEAEAAGDRGALRVLHFRTSGLFSSDAMEGDFYAKVTDQSKVRCTHVIVNLKPGSDEFRQYFHEAGALGMVVLAPDGEPIAKHGGPMEVDEAVWLLVTAQAAWSRGVLRPEAGDALAYDRAAREFLRLGCGDQAERIYSDLALGNDPAARETAALGLARLALLQGDVEGASGRLSSASALDSPERRYLQGLLHFQRRELSLAREHLDGLPTEMQDTPEVAFYWALCLHETGEDGRAANLLRRVAAVADSRYRSAARGQLAHIHAADHGHSH